jgi:hypothetical protein
MKLSKIHSPRARQLGLATLALLASLTCGISAGVPVRISVKFILNSSGNRAAAGDLNTDAEVAARIADATSMFKQNISELRLDNLEIVDVAGASSWYSAEPTTANRDGLRSAAMAAPTTYHWRSDAVNIYITGAPGALAGGIADFPPNNNIILLPQYVWDNVIAHEVGHILSLYHTHETCCYANKDACDDTLSDSTSWTQDDIAMNNFSGLHYNQLNAVQQDLVNQTWFNVMSYHNGNTALRLSPCQMNRQSSQAYTDRSRFLTKTPVYVASGYVGTQNGSFSQPFQTIQQAMNSGTLNGKVMVLQAGGHTRPSGAINLDVEAVTRWNTSTIQCLPVPFTLPSQLEESTNSAVRQAVVRAQQSDRRGALAEVINYLQEAEGNATGDERTAPQLELAHRFRDSDQFEESASWFKKASELTLQEGVRTRALERAATMKNRAEAKRLEGAQTENHK